MHTRRSNAGSSCGALRGSGGFTLTEVLVVVALIAVLVAILLPVLFAQREDARKDTCLLGEHQFGAAIAQYLQDNDDYLPTTDTWRNRQLPGLVATRETPLDRVLHCPSVGARVSTVGEVYDPKTGKSHWESHEVEWPFGYPGYGYSAALMGTSKQAYEDDGHGHTLPTVVHVGVPFSKVQYHATTVAVGETILERSFEVIGSRDLWGLSSFSEHPFDL